MNIGLTFNKPTHYPLDCVDFYSNLPVLKRISRATDSVIAADIRKSGADHNSIFNFRLCAVVEQTSFSVSKLCSLFLDTNFQSLLAEAQNKITTFKLRSQM